MNTPDFNIEVLKHKNNLTLFAQSLTSNNEKAQDLVQETYLKAIVNKQKFKTDTNLKAWLFTIMKNLFINEYRKKQKRQTFLPESLFYTIDNELKNNNHPEVHTSKNEIKQKIESLDHKLRIPFVMHIEGYKYKEISLKLSLKLGTVKSRIYMARIQLIEALPGY
ncbi:MAG: sigma-70 family RNA polymerase sigma factor [Bacteroidales bacterium]